MELKNVENNAKRNYPKINEISKKKVKNNVLNKWTKLVFSTATISMLIKNHSFATATSILNSLSGDSQISTTSGLTTIHTGYYYVGPIIEIIATIIFLITGLNILKVKMKNKKLEVKEEAKKIKSWTKIFFIISAIVIIVNLIVWIYLNIKIV